MMDKVTQGERCQDLKESLIQRDEERKEKLRLSKEQRESCPNEAKNFASHFEKQTKVVLDSIKLIEEGGVNLANISESLNSLKREINSLNEYFSVSSKYLPKYTRKKSMDTIESFEDKLKDLMEELLPRKKFSFKAKNKNTELKPSDVAENDKRKTAICKDEIDSVTNKIVSLSKASCGFSNRKYENLKLYNDEISKNDVELRNLDNCTIFLCGNPSTVHMSNITSCKIFSGPVSTSVFIENCSSSDIVIACQQLRIHSTNDTRFYIHITSRVIIEDTQNIQLAPYNLEYDELQNHFNNSGLRTSPNNWNMVDDFNWLANDAPSPNWNEISEDKRTLSWTSFISF